MGAKTIPMEHVPVGASTIPGMHVVALCVKGARWMSRLARPGAVELVDFHLPGALERFPGLTHAECMRAAQLVTSDGVASGLEAIVRALGTRSIFKVVAPLYFLPGIRPLADALYRWVARNRYRFMGRAPCESDACALHETSR